MNANKQTQANHSVNVLSFGFKNGDPPQANVIMDVRFLKNPFWVEELRPLTGRDQPVRDYVMEQSSAQEFMGNLKALVSHVIPAMFHNQANVDSFTIALGCTGGQHKSVAVAEEVAKFLQDSYPQYKVSLSHRELDQLTNTSHGEESLALQEGG